MKKRQIYYSRKAGGIVIEGRRGNKTIYLYKLPTPIKLLQSLNLPEEKINKIMQKIQSLNIINKRGSNPGKKVLAIKIMRTQGNSEK